MFSPNQTSNFSTALLSAITESETGDGLSSASGQPVLAHQVAALRSLGIRNFLIEVDTVPGTVLAMADRLTQGGCSVDFVRSARDLQAKLAIGSTLIFQAEGVYIAPGLLSSLLGQSSMFISTVDGQIENEAFERMDLNTRWAGLAVVSAKTVANIGEFPDGWSMTSALLRQAMQDGVVQQAVKQSHLQQGDLRRIDLAADAASLTNEMMVRRASREPGFIENRIFAPAAAKLASLLWSVNSRALLADGSALLTAAGSLALASFGYTVSAAIAAIASILGNSVRLALGNGEQDQQISGWVEKGMWLLLAAALMMATSRDAYRSIDGLFAGGVVAGLTLLARQLRLPDWARKTLQSPALLALLLLLTAPITGIAIAAHSLGALQILLLIGAKWNHKPIS